MKKVLLLSLAGLTLACQGSLDLATSDAGGPRPRGQSSDAGPPDARVLFDGGELVLWGAPQTLAPERYKNLYASSTQGGLAAIRTSCIERCVPVDDLCADVSCDQGFTCVGGECITGCFFEPCTGVDCAPGYYCASGRCLPIIECTKSCEDGFACHLICPPLTDSCADTACGECERCEEGECVEDLCACTECARDSSARSRTAKQPARSRANARSSVKRTKSASSASVSCRRTSARAVDPIVPTRLAEATMGAVGAA
jgi:hypothetical protein